MSEIKLKPVLFKGKKYKNGESPIMIRLTRNRDSVYISINYTALPSQWNEVVSRLYESMPRVTDKQKSSLNREELRKLQSEYKAIELHPNRKKVNQEIIKANGAIQLIIDKYKALEKPITLNAIKEIYQSKDNNADLSFLKFADKKAEEFKISGRFRTYKRYKTIIQKLRKYLGKKDLAFLELNKDFLVKYESYLRNELNNKTNTIHTNLKTIRAIYYMAIKEKYIDQSNNPFFIHSLVIDKKTKKDKLTLEELIKIKDLKLKEDSFLNHARNSFIFSFYNAGIRIGDLMLLKWENITSEGRLEYKMGKQGTEKSIKLRPESLQILNSYKPKKVNKGAFIFPFLPEGIDEKGINENVYKKIESNTTRINNALKEIAKTLGIEKNVRNHISRHTFSDIARQKKASIYDISKALGHASIKQTESYLKSFDEGSLDEALDKVFSEI